MLGVSSRFSKVYETLHRLDAQGRLKRVFLNADNKAEIESCLSDISSVVTEVQLSLQVRLQSKMREVQEEIAIAGK